MSEVPPGIVVCVHEYLLPVLTKLNEIGQHPVSPGAIGDDPDLIGALRAIGVDPEILDEKWTHDLLSDRDVWTPENRIALLSAFQRAVDRRITFSIPDAHDGDATTVRPTNHSKNITIKIRIARTAYPKPPDKE